MDAFAAPGAARIYVPRILPLADPRLRQTRSVTKIFKERDIGQTCEVNLPISPLRELEELRCV
ncbi:hypothetical protein BMI88_14720 [Thioclava sp. F36-6]|nr:hypothetical protein BMI88_14720 [Thioclava sp. F36-6]